MIPAYVKALDEKKACDWCGDLNVAHKEIDLKNPKTNRKNAVLRMKGEIR
jgi:exodeoxyribonuclease-3